MNNPFEDLIPTQSRQDNPFEDLIPKGSGNRNPFEELVPLPTSALAIGASETAKDLRQLGAQFVRGAAGMAASVPESLGIAAHHLAGGLDAAGNPVPIEDVELYKAGKAIRGAAQAVLPVDESRPHRFAVDTLGQGAGSMAGALAGGVAARAAKLPAWMGAAATGATSQGADAFDEAKAKGADDQTAWLTFMLNAGVGTSEAWPIAKWLDRINRGSNGAVRRAIREGAEEMGQELFQQISQNAIAQQLYDPNRPWMEGAGESGAAGLTLGALGGLIFHGHGPHETNRRAETQAPTPTQPGNRLPSTIPSGMEVVPGESSPLPTTTPETPALQGPVAVFQGSRGEDLRVQVGSAGLDSAKEYAMRVWPGAAFVGVDGEQTTPKPEIQPNTNPTEGGETHVKTQEGRQEGLLSQEPAPEPEPAANGPAPEAGAMSPDEQAQAQADLAATQDDDETDTAGKPRESRGKAAEQTETIAPEAPTRVARGSSLRKRFQIETETMGEDILSWISDNGRMMSRSAAQRGKSKEWWSKNKSLYDDAVKLKSPHHGIFYGGEQTPDQVADAAYRAGILKSPDVTALWAAIDKASTGRSGGVKAAKAEQEWIKTETAAHENWKKATDDGAVRISSSDLQVGDVLEVEGERVKVTAVDPDTLDVTLQDGRKFGKQVVADGSTLHVEKVEREEGGKWAVPSSAPKSQFSLDAPESVEQQKARQQAEQQLAAQNQAKAKLEQLAAKPLTGTAGDLGQKDMFSPPEDLWAIPASNAGLVDNPASPKQVSKQYDQTGRQDAGRQGSPGQSQSRSFTEELRADSRANQEAQPQTSDHASAETGIRNLIEGSEESAANIAEEAAKLTTAEATAGALLDESASTAKSIAAEQLGRESEQRVTMNSVAAMTIAEARDWALHNLRGEFTNVESGMRISIARTGIEKSLSAAAVTKSTSRSVHLAALSQLPRLIEAGHLVESRPATKRTESIASIHRFTAPLEFAGQTWPVLMTIREAIDPPGRRFYTLEVSKIEMPTAKRATVMPEGTPSATTVGGDNLSSGSQPVKPGPRINPRSGEAGFVINPATIAADLLVAGARMLKRGGQWVMAKSTWVTRMVKAYGETIRKHLDGVWNRLARIQNQQANGVGPTAQGHLNAIESLAGKANIPEEQKPLYGPEVAAAGNPGPLTQFRPVSQQIRILGGQDLLKAKQRRDVIEATQAAAVKAQSDQLWSQLIQSAREANDLKKWQLPDWLIATPRARAFKQRAIHIAARLNAVGRQENGSFQFQDFVMRAGSMSVKEAARSQVKPGDSILLNDPITGQQESVTLGQLVTPPTGGAFYQLHRTVTAATQTEIYEHFAREYPEMIWFLDTFIDPALANTRTTINGIEIPVFNRFASAAMMADGDPNFQPLTAYTPDVLVTRSLVGAVRGALSFAAGTRSPGRKYKSGTSREGGHVRDLLSGFNVRTWQMLAEKSRKAWMQSVLKAATPIKQDQVPIGWVKVETGMENLWQAVKRLRNWKSPESWRPLKQSELDDLEEFEAKLGPNDRIAMLDGKHFLVTKLFPETEARMSEKGFLADEDLEYRKFFGEAMALRGKQLMLPEALVDQLVRKYAAQEQHGTLYRMAGWSIRNSLALDIVHPQTYVSNVLTNDLFVVEAGIRRILSGVAGRNSQDLRFARELAIGEGFKWFPGLRRLVDGQFRDSVDAILPDSVFANQTQLADLRVRLDEDPMSLLRQGEIGSAALNFIRYGNIDVVAKQRVAFAWLRAQATTNARKAGLRGEALRNAVDRYLRNPPVDDRASAIEIANFELLNYADSPALLEKFANNPFGRLVVAFPRFGYHYISKYAQRAAAVRDLLGKVPPQRRAEAFADVVSFVLALGGHALTIEAIRRFWKLFTGKDDDEDIRTLVGTSQTKELGPDGEVVVKPMDRSLVTANRVNLTGWARQLGLGDPNREEDFWIRVRSYPVISMAGAALLAMGDAKRFGVKEGALTYARGAMDLAADFFSVGMAVKVPDKMLQILNDRSAGKNPPQMVFDPYGTRVPFLAYITDQTLSSFLPGVRQANVLVQWMDPVQRRRTASKQLEFNPTAWDAARVGHWTGLFDRLMSPNYASTLPPEGPVKRGYVEPQTYPLEQRVSNLLGFNVRPINRRAYEEALKLWK